MGVKRSHRALNSSEERDRKQIELLNPRHIHRPSLTRFGGQNDVGERSSSSTRGDKDNTSEFLEDDTVQQFSINKFKVGDVPVQGLLSTHVTVVSLVTFEVTEQARRDVYVRISLGTQSKITAIYEMVKCPGKLIFDDLKHFTVTVWPKKMNPLNLLKVELIIITKTTPLIHTVLSSKEVHIYDIIRKQTDNIEFELRSNKNDCYVGTLNIQYCFCYGRHGYGIANQIKMADQKPKVKVMNSTMLRTPNTNTLKFDTDHPDVINYKQRICYDEDEEVFKEVSCKDKPLPTPEALFNMSDTRKKIMSTLDSMIEIYDNQMCREDRHKYIKNTIANNNYTEKYFTLNDFKVNTKFYSRKYNFDDTYLDTIGVNMIGNQTSPPMTIWDRIYSGIQEILDYINYY